jgi:hypothetical protein
MHVEINFVISHASLSFSSSPYGWPSSFSLHSTLFSWLTFLQFSSLTFLKRLFRGVFLMGGFCWLRVCFFYIRSLLFSFCALGSRYRLPVRGCMFSKFLDRHWRSVKISSTGWEVSTRLEIATGFFICTATDEAASFILSVRELIVEVIRPLTPSLLSFSVASVSGTGGTSFPSSTSSTALESQPIRE